VRENIHKSIAALTASLFHNPPRFRVILAPESGGSHRVQLVSTQARSHATTYCWPDIVITRDGEVRIVLEIQQTGIVSPGRIGGKLLPTSLSKYLYTEDIGSEPTPFNSAITFIQIVNIALFPLASQKPLQYEYLESSIRGVLPLGCVSRYFLFPILANAAPLYSAAKYDSVLNVIDDALGYQ
jgi:hypothetical protein